MGIGIYARISTDSEHLGLGVGRQEDDARTISRLRGWDVTDVYVDNDVSAFITRVIRPEFERMLTDLSNKRIDGIVAYDLDRFARQPSDLERAIRIFDARHGLVFATVQGDVDLSTPDGRTMARVLVAFANKASMDTSRRTRRKYLEMAQSGRIKRTRFRPFGWQEDRVSLNEPEATAIRDAAQDVLNGQSLHSIARRWNEMELQTSAGSAWIQKTVRNVLISPRLAGYGIYQREMALDQDGQRVMSERTPILDTDTWEALQAVIRHPSRTGPPAHVGARKRLLTALLRCGLCGKPLQSDFHAREQIHIYTCKPYSTRRGCGKIRVSGPRVDELISELTLRYLAERHIEPESSWWREGELASARERIRELMDAYAEARLSAEVVFPAVSKLEAEANELASARSAWLANQMRDRAVPEDVRTAWPNMDLHEQRSVIDSVIENVIIKPAAKAGGRFDPERVEVIWR
ncbi:MAG TPA: recombinase family protein [Candidatus Saccharimonadales bacterium]|nr:recombinase family protein [Candidatus Saccharimonadales bacterium]